MIDSVKKYIENRIQLLKLELITVLANVSANLIHSLLISLFLVIICTMFSFSIAYFIGHYFDNTAIGFAAVGGIAIVVFLIYMIYFTENGKEFVRSMRFTSEFGLKHPDSILKQYEFPIPPPPPPPPVNFVMDSSFTT